MPSEIIKRDNAAINISVSADMRDQINLMMFDASALIIKLKYGVEMTRPEGLTGDDLMHCCDLIAGSAKAICGDAAYYTIVGGITAGHDEVWVIDFLQKGDQQDDKD